MKLYSSVRSSLPVRPARSRAAAASRVADWRNLGILVAGWLLLLLVVPPAHEYPIIDDWNHAASVRTLLDTGQLVMPPTVQANLFGLTVWGAAWSKLFGFSFTTLTYSTLALALAGLLAFYGIARAVGVAPWGALLGAGLLALNPLFVHLSYSFMTDVPFLSLCLIACYLYIKGLQSARFRSSMLWLLAGGLFASWAFTIRQFGALVPLAFVLYLAYDGLVTRKWRCWEMLAIAAAPALAIGGWTLLRHDIPPNQGMEAAAERRNAFFMKEPWLRVALIRALILLPVAALSAWAAVKIPRRHLWLVALSAAAVTWGLYALDLPGEMWAQVHTPPFTVQLGPVTFPLPQQAYTFGGVGNIVQVNGIDFFQYGQEPVWPPEAWRLLWLFGLGLGVVLLAAMAGGLIDWLREVWRQWQQRPSYTSPRVGVYLFGGLVFVASAALLGDVYDRYALQLVPFLVLFVVRGSRRWGRWAWSYSLVALALIATFTVLVKTDQIDHGNARWEAAQWLYARTGGLHAGYDWDNWVGGWNENYQIADMPIEGFRTERVFPYVSRLGGFTTRYVYAQARIDAPPVP